MSACTFSTMVLWTVGYLPHHLCGQQSLTFNVHRDHASPPLSKARSNWPKMPASSSALPCELFESKAQWLIPHVASWGCCTRRHKLQYSRELCGRFYPTEKSFLQFSSSHPVVLCPSLGTFFFLIVDSEQCPNTDVESRNASWGYKMENNWRLWRVKMIR